MTFIYDYILEMLKKFRMIDNAANRSECYS